MFESEKLINRIMFNGASVPIATTSGENNLFAYLNKTLESIDDVNGVLTTSFTASSQPFLKSVNLPALSGMTGYNMFANCPNLITVNMPQITSLNGNTFQSCTSLSSITLPAVSYCGGNVFGNCRNLKEVYLPELLTFSGSPFSSCYNLQRVYAPKLVNMIGGNTFAWCSSLEEIDFPECTNSAADAKAYNLFSNCISLKRVNLPKLQVGSSNTEGFGLFYNCYSLSYINLANYSKINDYSTFRECKSLETLIIGTALSEVCVITTSTIFDTTPISKSSYLGYYGSIYVPASLVDAYKTATNWATYSDRITSIDNLPTT